MCGIIGKIGESNVTPDLIEGLKKLELSLEDLTAVLVTHEHYDHISSLAMLEKAAQMDRGIGRAALREALLREGVFATDHQIRRLLHLLSQRDMVRIGKSKQGCRLSGNGGAFLRFLERQRLDLPPKTSD